MPTKRYTLRALRAYLANKPANKWNDHIQHDFVDKTCCVLGHLEDLVDMEDALLWDDNDPQGVLTLFAQLQRPGDDVAGSLAIINNGDDPRYQQKTPRARVLKAIDDLIAGKVPKAP